MIHHNFEYRVTNYIRKGNILSEKQTQTFLKKLCYEKKNVISLEQNVGWKKEKNILTLQINEFWNNSYYNLIW